MCAKTSGCDRRIAEIAVYEAVIIFNEDRRGWLDVRETLDIQVGKHVRSAQVQSYSKCLGTAEKWASLNTIDGRKARQIQQNSINIKNAKKERNVYKPGEF